jgi:hypothetical protein
VKAWRFTGLQCGDGLGVEWLCAVVGLVKGGQMRFC